MDANCFVQSEIEAHKARRQSQSVEHLKSIIGPDEWSNIRSSIILRNNIELNATHDQEGDEVDDLVQAAIKGLDGMESAPEGSPDASPDKTSWFWTYVLAIPIIFTHGVATRMQFMYGGLYGRDGLGLSNAAAILAVGCTAAGRATAPPLLLRFFDGPRFFMFLNATTLLGCALMALIPFVGGRNNFYEDGTLREGVPTAGVGTVIFYYIAMYIQGLAEVLSGWDVLMKFEMRNWAPARQQIAFRASFVSIALGSATAFFSSSWLYESHGLYGCVYLGLATGVLNVILPGFYLYRRWGIFSDWREGNKKERTRICRRSQPMMKMLHLDRLEESDDECEDGQPRRGLKRTSTLKLNLVKNSSKAMNVIDDEEASGNEESLGKKSQETPGEDETPKDYVEPRNHFEYQKLLQHQTSTRLLQNFRSLGRKDSSGLLRERSSHLSDEDVLSAFDPTVLLTHSKHINWPRKFEKQIQVMKWFCILALALGSTMISSQFAVYTLYLVDVWDVSPVFAGTSMAIGEIAGMLTLVVSILLEGMQNKRENVKEGPVVEPKTKSHDGKSTGWRALIRSPSLLLQVPSKFVVCCFVSVIPLALLGLVKGPSGSDEEEPEETSITDPSSWPAGLTVALLSGIAVGIINCVMHATTIEMSALLLLDDLFGSAVAFGYSIRRIVNLAVCLAATLLYSLSEYAVYQAVSLLYLVSVPVSVYVLQYFVQCMPWQEREVFLQANQKDEKEGIVDKDTLAESRSASLDDSTGSDS